MIDIHGPASTPPAVLGAPSSTQRQAPATPSGTTTFTKAAPSGQEVAAWLAAWTAILGILVKIGLWAKGKRLRNREDRNLRQRRIQMVDDVPQIKATQEAMLKTQESMMGMLQSLLMEQKINRVSRGLDLSIQKMYSYHTNAQGRCIWASTELADLYGLSQDQMTSENGTGWLQHVHKDDRDRVWSHWQDCLTKDVIYTDTFRITPSKFTPPIELSTTARRVYGEESMGTKGQLVLFYGRVWIKEASILDGPGLEKLKAGK